MKKIIFYMHAGSANHGCEAILNSILKMLHTPAAVITNSAEEDRTYSLRDTCELLSERKFSEHKAAHILYYLYRRLTGDGESFIRYRYHKVFNKARSLTKTAGVAIPPLAVSIGGDNYCYDIMVRDLILANSAFHKQGTKTVLLGCSIEPELLRDPAIIRDMNTYTAIYARESITYRALRNILDKGTRLLLYPDPAFALGRKDRPLPDGFAEKNTVGINISPMIQENEPTPGITMAAYRSLLQHIIDDTDMQIALIPHVVWARNDDRRPLTELYSAFRHTGRVVQILDGSCEELKGDIARCRFFVGARTHATIAAYSSLVPTLTVGYSVKARGIATDLFDTDEHFVIPVQSLHNENDLTAAFQWLIQNEAAIRQRLAAIMPEYRDQALQLGKEVEKLWAELN